MNLFCVKNLEIIIKYDCFVNQCGTNINLMKSCAQQYENERKENEKERWVCIFEKESCWGLWTSEHENNRICTCDSNVHIFNKKNENKENISPHTLSPVLSQACVCAALTHTLTHTGGGTPTLGTGAFDIEVLFDWNLFDWGFCLFVRLWEVCNDGTCEECNEVKWMEEWWKKKSEKRRGETRAIKIQREGNVQKISSPIIVMTHTFLSSVSISHTPWAPWGRWEGMGEWRWKREKEEGEREYEGKMSEGWVMMWCGCSEGKCWVWREKENMEYERKENEEERICICLYLCVYLNNVQM